MEFCLRYLESLGQNNSTKIIYCLYRNWDRQICLSINIYLFSASIKLINRMSYTYYIQIAYY